MNNCQAEVQVIAKSNVIQDQKDFADQVTTLSKWSLALCTAHCSTLLHEEGGRDLVWGHPLRPDRGEAASPGQTLVHIQQRGVQRKQGARHIHNLNSSQS